MAYFSIPSIVLATALGIGALTTANAAPYTVLNTDDSRILFGYSQMGVGMSGGFSQIKATEFSFDPANPETAKVAIEIPLSSIDAGYDEANAELEKDEWLKTAAYPLAAFKSTKVESLGENRYQVTGELTIKGDTKVVTAPFTFTEKDDSASFEGEFTFQRADFGIGEGQWRDFSIVANDIQIKFQVLAGR